MGSGPSAPAASATRCSSASGSGRSDASTCSAAPAHSNRRFSLQSDDVAETQDPRSPNAAIPPQRPPGLSPMSRTRFRSIIAAAVDDGASDNEGDAGAELPKWSEVYGTVSPTSSCFNRRRLSSSGDVAAHRSPCSLAQALPSPAAAAAAATTPNAAANAALLPTLAVTPPPSHNGSRRVSFQIGVDVDDECTGAAGGPKAGLPLPSPPAAGAMRNFAFPPPRSTAAHMSELSSLPTDDDRRGLRVLCPAT